jgi:hypothetical protein
VLTLPRQAGAAVGRSPIPVEPPDAAPKPGEAGDASVDGANGAATPGRTHHPGSIVTLRGRRD